MIAPRPSFNLMEVLRSRFKLRVSLLTCSAVLACTCAAYDVNVRHMWGALLQVTGFGRVPSGPVTRETVVAAGNELSVDGGRVTVTKVPSDVVTQRLAWARIHLQRGWIEFQGETLETVAAEFNRHNGRRLVMGDAATAHLRVGGKFHLADLDGFLAALEVTHGVKAIPAPPNGGKTPILVLIGGDSASAYSDESPDPSDP
jgi:ferric-dicitrate binding protein FerR (iron transport regulator)